MIIKQLALSYMSQPFNCYFKPVLGLNCNLYFIIFEPFILIFRVNHLNHNNYE